MWVVTQTGFISIIQRLPEDTNLLNVRSRDQLSLLAICKTLRLNRHRVMHTPEADYEFRLELTREQVNKFLASQVQAVDYPNFKDRVTQTRGKRWHDALLDVWFALLATSTTRPYYRTTSSTR